MAADQYMQENALVIKALGQGRFMVLTEDTQTEVLCTLSGKIKQNNIRIIEGDKVAVDVSVFDTSRGRITFRYKG